MKYREHKIDSVEPESIAEQLGIEPGDILVSVNGKEIRDVFDYHYLINDDALTLLVRRPDGQEWELEIEKDYYEDLGIGFENGLMDDYRSCRNKCIFCFIDQMPPGMRKTLYFKDDDSRLSFLQGNYVTLTNLTEEDVKRIITYKLAPINISVHTTNPKLRCGMLQNRFAGESLGLIRTFFEAGIVMNGQIVLCKGINDGEELERSIRELAEYLPYMESLSVVPVGLTKYREGLYPLEPFSREDAKQVLAVIRKWQEICFEKHSSHFVHAGDEWYLLAGENFPPEETYDGFVQLENGVGMIPLLQSEFEECLSSEKAEEIPAGAGMPRGRFFSKMSGRRQKESSRDGDRQERVLSIATGKLAAPLMRKLCAEFSCRHPRTQVRIYEIENRFFGERITVSGLLTGRDILEQLKGKELGEKLLLPCSMMRSGEEVFLDDMTRGELEKALQVPVHIVKSDGQSLYEELSVLSP